MQSIILTAALVILVALAGCSSPTQAPDTPTPSPAATPTRSSSPTQEPTAATVPTRTPTTPPATKPTPVFVAAATPEAPSTPAPKGETSSGVLSPLVLDDPMYDDPESVNALLSEAELACIKEIEPGMDRTWSWDLLSHGNPKDLVKIIGCLGDEILARIFFADTAEGVPTLSLETSTCIRAAFKVIDPRSMMLAKAEGFPEDTLNQSTTLSLVTMACLNDEEWESIEELLWKEPGLRGWMQCMMEELGGPGEMAAAMTKWGRGDQEALAEAAEDCSEEAGPMPGETPAAPEDDTRTGIDP